MDRSSDNISQTISNIQRDIEELKTTQLTGGIADGSISAKKIDWSSFPCIETSFYFTDKADREFVDVVTNKGTSVRIAFLPGCVPYILSGGDDIRMIEVKAGGKFSSGLTDGYSIIGIGSGATVYTRKHIEYPNTSTISTGEKATVQSWNVSVGDTTVYGAVFADIGSGAKTSCFVDYSVIKYDTSLCLINGIIGSDGSLSSLQFETHVSSIPASVFPGIFQGGNASYYVGGYGYIKIIESPEE